MKRAIFFVSILLLLTSCFTTRPERYNRVCQGFIGSKIDSAVYAWGAPQSVYDFGNGEKMYQFSKSNIKTTGGYYLPAGNKVTETIDYSGVDSRGKYVTGTATVRKKQEYIPVERHVLQCTTRFVVDKNGIIRSFKWEGEGCDR